MYLPMLVNYNTQGVNRVRGTIRTDVSHIPKLHLHRGESYQANAHLATAIISFLDLPSEIIDIIVRHVYDGL